LQTNVSSAEFPPKLHYLCIGVKHHANCAICKPVYVRVLIDTGCAKTVISKTFYELLCDRRFVRCANIFKYHIQKTNMSVQACIGKATPIIGLIDLTIIFEDDTANILNCMVVDNLSESFILGNDF